jgi:transcriptional regulator with XRE-family HTH domain
MGGNLNLFVSEALARKRLSTGMSVEDLSRMTGISAERLTEYESDSSGMDFRSLQLIADALDEDIVVFFSGFLLDRQKSGQEIIDT